MSAITTKFAYVIPDKRGPRLFLHNGWSCNSFGLTDKYDQALIALSRLSIWKGHDKTWIINKQTHWGFEFTKETFWDAINTLATMGFKFKLLSTKDDVVNL